MDKLFKKIFHRAMLEERRCAQCGWMITKVRWEHGFRLCTNCEDALKGANVSSPYGKWRDEPVDKTGEML